VLFFPFALLQPEQWGIIIVVKVVQLRLEQLLKKLDARILNFGVHLLAAESRCLLWLAVRVQV
jgi:hypothetical protein